MIYCRGCERQAPESTAELEGWYRVQLKGEFKPRASNIQPGVYCSEVCLTVACLFALNVPRPEIDAWIADVTREGVSA